MCVVYYSIYCTRQIEWAVVGLLLLVCVCCVYCSHHCTVHIKIHNHYVYMYKDIFMNRVYGTVYGILCVWHKLLCVPDCELVQCTTLHAPCICPAFFRQLTIIILCINIYDCHVSLWSMAMSMSIEISVFSLYIYFDQNWLHRAMQTYLVVFIILCATSSHRLDFFRGIKPFVCHYKSFRKCSRTWKEERNNP